MVNGPIKVHKTYKGIQPKEVERKHVHGYLNEDDSAPPMRTRPKVGDKDPNWKPRTKRRRAAPAPQAKKELPYKHRDYRGTKGALKDLGE